MWAEMSMNVSDYLRVISLSVLLFLGYQFAAEHGEVCPANWTKGKKTMKPDPVLSKSYFKSEN
jgi:alkyl hydroperoxide reductase subunit AhpC